jgi:hypothetical protein
MDVGTLATQLGRQANDPDTVRCFAAAVSWACTTLGREADDTLEDLTGDRVAAVLGYAADLIKLPKATFGYFDQGALDGMPAQVGQLGRRWAPQLLYGSGVIGGMA